MGLSKPMSKQDEYEQHADICPCKAHLLLRSWAHRDRDALWTLVYWSRNLRNLQVEIWVPAQHLLKATGMDWVTLCSQAHPNLRQCALLFAGMCQSLGAPIPMYRREPMNHTPFWKMTSSLCHHCAIESILWCSIYQTSEYRFNNLTWSATYAKMVSYWLYLVMGVLTQSIVSK